MALGKLALGQDSPDFIVDTTDERFFWRALEIFRHRMNGGLQVQECITLLWTMCNRHLLATGQDILVYHTFLRNMVLYHVHSDDLFFPMLMRLPEFQNYTVAPTNVRHFTRRIRIDPVESPLWFKWAWESPPSMYHAHLHLKYSGRIPRSKLASDYATWLEQHGFVLQEE